VDNGIPHESETSTSFSNSIQNWKRYLLLLLVGGTVAAIALGSYFVISQKDRSVTFTAAPQRELDAKTKQILAFHEGGVVSKDYNKYVSTAQANAKETDLIDIKNCVPEPGVAKVKREKEFSVQNSGDHKIRVFITELELDIEPHQKVPVKLTYPEGVLVYGCSFTDRKEATASGVVSLIN
jgi:hypothetical protein